jgi:hypothetical protein
MEFFRFVKDSRAADRLAALVREYPYVAAAADAVFNQQRHSDVSVLRRAAEEQNADHARLVDLARKLESGVSCPE